ncbi:hypothetical protein ScPMuIL_000315 [Solemya velum]
MLFLENRTRGCLEMVGRRPSIHKPVLKVEPALADRPKRNVSPKTLDISAGLSWKEERELKKALYASLQESRRQSASPDAKRVQSSHHMSQPAGICVRSRLLSLPVRTTSTDDSSQDSTRSSVSSRSNVPETRKSSIRAQRKFAQGSLPPTPCSTPVKTAPKPSTVQVFNRRAKTEDFLTFLCLRGTPVLPTRLDFFSFSRDEVVGESSCPNTPSGKAGGVTRESSPTSSHTSSSHTQEDTPDLGRASPISKQYYTPIKKAARACASTPETARGLAGARPGGLRPHPGRPRLASTKDSHGKNKKGSGYPPPPKLTPIRELRHPTSRQKKAEQILAKKKSLSSVAARQVQPIKRGRGRPRINFRESPPALSPVKLRTKVADTGTHLGPPELSPVKPRDKLAGAPGRGRSLKHSPASVQVPFSKQACNVDVDNSCVDSVFAYRRLTRLRARSIASGLSDISVDNQGGGTDNTTDSDDNKTNIMPLALKENFLPESKPILPNVISCSRAPTIAHASTIPLPAPPLAIQRTLRSMKREYTCQIQDACQQDSHSKIYTSSKSPVEEINSKSEYSQGSEIFLDSNRVGVCENVDRQVGRRKCETITSATHCESLPLQNNNFPIHAASQPPTLDGMLDYQQISLDSNEESGNIISLDPQIPYSVEMEDKAGDSPNKVSQGVGHCGLDGTDSREPSKSGVPAVGNSRMSGIIRLSNQAQVNNERPITDTPHRPTRETAPETAIANNVMYKNDESEIIEEMHRIKLESSSETITSTNMDARAGNPSVGFYQSSDIDSSSCSVAECDTTQDSISEPMTVASAAPCFSAEPIKVSNAASCSSAEPITVSNAASCSSAEPTTVASAASCSCAEPIKMPNPASCSSAESLKMCGNVSEFSCTEPDTVCVNQLQPNSDIEAPTYSFAGEPGTLQYKITQNIVGHTDPSLNGEPESYFEPVDFYTTCFNTDYCFDGLGALDLSFKHLEHHPDETNDSGICSFSENTSAISNLETKHDRSVIQKDVTPWKPDPLAEPESVLIPGADIGANMDFSGVHIKDELVTDEKISIVKVPEHMYKEDIQIAGTDVYKEDIQSEGPDMYKEDIQIAGSDVYKEDIQIAGPDVVTSSSAVRYTSVHTSLGQLLEVLDSPAPPPHTSTNREAIIGASQNDPNNTLKDSFSDFKSVTSTNTDSSELPENSRYLKVINPPGVCSAKNENAVVQSMFTERNDKPQSVVFHQPDSTGIGCLPVESPLTCTELQEIQVAPENLLTMGKLAERNIDAKRITSENQAGIDAGYVKRDNMNQLSGPDSYLVYRRMETGFISVEEDQMNYGNKFCEPELNLVPKRIGSCDSINGEERQPSHANQIGGQDSDPVSRRIQKIGGFPNIESCPTNYVNQLCDPDSDLISRGPKVKHCYFMEKELMFPLSRKKQYILQPVENLSPADVNNSKTKVESHVRCHSSIDKHPLERDVDMNVLGPTSNANLFVAPAAVCNISRQGGQLYQTSACKLSPLPPVLLCVETSDRDHENVMVPTLKTTTGNNSDEKKKKLKRKLKSVCEVDGSGYSHAKKLPRRDRERKRKIDEDYDFDLDYRATSHKPRKMTPKTPVSAKHSKKTHNVNEKRRRKNCDKARTEHRKKKRNSKVKSSIFDEDESSEQINFMQTVGPQTRAKKLISLSMSSTQLVAGKKLAQVRKFREKSAKKYKNIVKLMKKKNDVEEERKHSAVDPRSVGKNSVSPSKKGKSQDKQMEKTKIEPETYPGSGEPARILNIPCYYPTEEEFQDPLDYIHKISATARDFGMCKIVPPASWKLESKINEEMRFTSQKQFIHKVYKRWGHNEQQTECIRQHLNTIGVNDPPPVIGGVEVDLPKLYRTIQEFGGMHNVTARKKWIKVADAMKLPKQAQDRGTKLYDTYCKFLLSYVTLSTEEKRKLTQQVVAEREKREKSEIEDECIVRGKSMPLSTFSRSARNTMSVWFRDNPSPTPEQVESEYWRIVKDRTSHVTVHCGHVNTKTQGSLFPSKRDNFYYRHPWNLNNLTWNRDSLLHYLVPVSGASMPVIHLGMLFTTSCWSTDTHFLPYIQYLHSGADTIWYSVPGHEEEKFQGVMRELVPSLVGGKVRWLREDTVMVPPELLVENGVSVGRCVQKQHEFMIVFPKTYTSTISCGYNFSESVHYATLDWIPLGWEAAQDLNASYTPELFSMDVLLHTIAEDPDIPPQTLAVVMPLLELMVDKELKLQICFLSMVVNESDHTIYCLDQALIHVQKKRNLKSCKLLYRYSSEELQTLVQDAQRQLDQFSSVTTETIDKKRKPNKDTRTS